MSLIRPRDPNDPNPFPPEPIIPCDIPAEPVESEDAPANQYGPQPDDL
jgi:hypothetical protein